MKTTRKGFTLIELIVVIAIIGVLAAILVPAMLGYVKKSKINAANTDCKTIITTWNSAIEEMDENDITIPDGWYSNKLEEEGVTADDLKNIKEYLGYYSDAALSAKYQVCIKGGSAVASVSKNGKYFGTYPAFLTNKNYDEKLPSAKNNLDGAKEAVVAAYNDAHADSMAIASSEATSIGTTEKSTD